MENKVFVTETDEKYIKNQSDRVFFIIFLVLSLIACLGFFIAWQTFVFFEIIILLSCYFARSLRKNSNHCWRLKFENDDLTVINLSTNEVYRVWDIPASDFVITQTKREKGLDYCSVMIKNTVFTFGGIKNCTQLKKYIEINYIQ